jgi:hypothetical protein
MQDNPTTSEYLHDNNIPIEFKSDNGSEFVNHDLQDLFNNNNVSHERTSPYSPFQNGIAERSNRTVFELSSTLMTDANTPLYLWEYAVSTVIHTLNLLPNKALNLISTPFIELFHRPADVSHLRIFGCPAYTLLQEHERPVIGVRSVKCTFVGYDEHSLSYLVYYNHKVHKSRDVVFLESETINNKIDSNLHENISKLFSDNEIKNSQEERNIINNSFDYNIEVLNNSAPTNSIPNTQISNQPDMIIENTETVDTDTTSDNNNTPNHSVDRMNSSDGTNSNNRYNLRSNSNILNKKVSESVNIITSGQFFVKHHNSFFSETSLIIDESAIDPSDPNWITAKQAEINKLQAINTWEVTNKVPSDRKTLKYKWVLSTKYNIFGKFIYKARLTVKGCSQIPGIDFEETYAPVAKVTALRLILALATGAGLHAYQMDVQNAFPNATLNGIDIYMQAPPEMNLGNGMFLKLLRALYGLKQASREWYLLLISILGKLGFKACVSESCICCLIKGDIMIIVVIYVDDMTVVSNKFEHVQWLYNELKKYFVINMVPLTKMIGFNVQYNRIRKYMMLDKDDYTDNSKTYLLVLLVLKILHLMPVLNYQSQKPL